MDKTHRTEFRRIFLLEHLPEPMTRADAHLQIFDNYIADTRIRLRTIRVPETKERTHILQQKFADDETRATWKIAEIHLNEAEYQAFKSFEGREIRKNRYFWKFGGENIEIDIFLGNLQGLITARANFETLEQMNDFALPFNALEITNDEFFDGANLVEMTFTDVQNKN